ncbi:GNAT family protein [Rhodoglobus sp. NPDC076762]
MRNNSAPFGATQDTEPHLRVWRASDAPALIDAYRSSPELAVQLGSPDLATDHLARIFIADSLGRSDTHMNWAIVAESAAVGNVGISHIDRRHGTAWAYYWLAESARGRGLATRALATATECAFSAGLFRLELGHRLNNPASCGVATRAGFTVEGIQRQKLRYDHERFDVELHARLASDEAPTVRALPLQN